MNKYFFSVLLIIASTFPVFAQEDIPVYGEWEVYTFVGSFEDDPAPYLAFQEQHTDTLINPQFPVMFNLPDKLNPSEIISIDEYVKKYGDLPFLKSTEDGENGFLQEAISSFFKAMIKKTTTNPPVYSDIKITYVPDPNNPDSDYWVLPKTDYINNFLNLENKIIDTIGLENWETNYIGGEKKIIMFMFPFFDYSHPHGQIVNGNRIYISYRNDVLSETTSVVAHEICHSIPYTFYDSPKDYYIGYKDGAPLGATYCAAGPYDPMFAKGGGFTGQYQLYGIGPLNTNDLINYSPTSTFKIYESYENPLNNKKNLRIKSLRENLSTAEMNAGIVHLATIPIENIDFPESGELNGDFVTDQKFLIEYRNGKGWDNIAAMYRDGESKGVLISHIINDKSVYSRIIDIECTNSFPEYPAEGSRDPSVSFPDEFIVTDYANYLANGQWYFGRKDNDWLDDFAPNDVYPLSGGKNSWWKANDFRNQSLPSDFFYDEPGRNAFTPMTRPSTRSWKDNETNIAIFIDNIDEENNYADLTIYRNYHSTPLTSANAKTLPDGEKGLDILGDGYIGENFYVDENMFLYLGGGVNPEPKTTLVPGTDMHVRNNGVMQLKDYSKMRLENSSLTFDSGSIFNPTVYAEIELDGSNIFCESGFSISTIGTFNGFNISVSGVSSFYNSNFDMIGASLLTLEESSQFTVIAGSNIILSSQSVLTLKTGSELVIEPGANVVFEPGAKLVVESNAKITGTIKIPASATAILQSGSILTIGTRSSLVLDDGAKIEAYENAEIFIERGGSIITDNNITIGLIEMDYMPVSGTWKGITCDAETTVTLRNTRITGAVIGLSGMPENLLLTENCSFVDCETAVSIENCNNYEISYSNFNGSLKGQGIVLTQSTGNIFRNYIYEFDKGITLINSSPYIFNNQIYGNITYGLYATGFASIPQLIPLYTSYPPYNNNIWNNGVGNENGAQVCLDVQGKIYLDNGINNIYSEPLNVTPAVPCIKTLPEVVQATRKGDVPNPVFRYEIPALMNYWGSTSVNGNYFELNSSYTIAYLPYSTVKYPTLNPSPHPNPPQTGTKEEVIMLASAIEDEFYGKYADAKVKYDTLISEYAKTNEAMVAYAKLPNVYSKLGLDLSVLNSAYDIVLSSNVKNLDVNFFKELKVSAYLKNKLYDDAIALAQQMLQAATSENEAIISQKDIDIANRLKGISGKSSGVTGEYDNPSSISDSVLPKEHSLFQNYPNPFNPVTSIDFALSKASEVKLSVYNISGQIVAELVNGTKQAGLHSVDFDGSKLNSGVYYYTLVADGKNITKKMVLTK